MSQIDSRKIVMHARIARPHPRDHAAAAACGSPEKRAADYLVKAQEFYDAGDYVKAQLEAQNAAQVEPKNAKARYLLPLVAEQEEEYQQMFGHLLVAVDGDPDNVEARHQARHAVFSRPGLGPGGEAGHRAAEAGAE